MELKLIQNGNSLNLTSKIFEIRGFRVMADFHLAELYQVETRVLKQSVRRNIDRFPDDFMFRLSDKEANQLISIGVSQNVIPPGYNVGATDVFVFTEQGVAMLSSVLKSKVAISINISIMRAFVQMREFVIGYADIKQQLDSFMIETNMQFNEIYQALTEMAEQKRLEDNTHKIIGFIKPESK